MLRDATVVPTIPVRDLERAQAFYQDMLGLAPVEESQRASSSPPELAACSLCIRGLAANLPHTLAEFQVHGTDHPGCCSCRARCCLSGRQGVRGLARQRRPHGSADYTAARVYVLRYCPDCGQDLAPPDVPTERVVSRTCPACGAMHFRNAKPCAGALVVRNGRVLLGRRALDPARGCWDIPGGFLDPWEHPAHGAVRELREETGLQVRLERLLAVTVDTYQDRDYTLNLYYLAEVVGGTERPADDLAELRWFGPGELPRDLAFPHCARVLAAWQASVEGT